MRFRPSLATASLILGVAIAALTAISLLADPAADPVQTSSPSSTLAARAAPSASPTSTVAPVTPTPTAAANPTPAPAGSAVPTATPTPAPTRATQAPVRTPAPAPTPLPPTAIVPGAADRASIDLAATYDADVRIGWDDLSFAVDSTATVTNTSGGPIDRLELNTLVARLGAMKLDVVTVDGRAASASVDDQTIVVPLGGVLPEGATASVRVAYRATLRTSVSGSSWLFTRANGIINAYRWLPWVSRRVPFDRPNHGDPFVTPASASVTVRVTTDRSMGLATTGEAIADSGLTHTYRATNVRDFVITASPTYRTSSAKEGDTTVRVFYRDGAPASAMIGAARDALRAYEALVGPYPHSVFNVAQSAGGYGMEGPGIIWIPTGVASGNLRYLVHHETAHQWFYGMVGGDQAAEPFTDEAAADFLARFVLGQRRASRCEAARLDLSIYDYSSACYYETVYIQGGNLLDDLRRDMGDDAFWAALRSWTDANRGSIATTKSLLEVLDNATSADLAPVLQPRFPRLYPAS